MINVTILVVILTHIRLIQGVCYFGPGDNCFYPCRCQDAPVGAYTGGVCDSQTGRCSSGCMERRYNTSHLYQYWKDALKSYDCIDGQNIAEGKPATQINGSPKEAAKAVDYYTDRHEPDSGRFCTSIYSGHPHVGAWWRVDLQGTYYVFQVFVYSSYNEAEAKSFEHIQVRISEGLTSTGYDYTECAYTSSSFRYKGQPGAYIYHTCNTYNTQHILVDKTGGEGLSNLTICEVQARGYKYYQLGTNCSRCQSSSCGTRGFCTNCKSGYHGPTCADLRTINGSLTISGELFKNTLLDKSSLEYQQLNGKLSYWLNNTCPDEGNGCYNKLGDVTFSPGSIQADFTLQVLNSQTDHSVLLTILAMINNDTFTAKDTAYVIDGTTVTLGNISEATIFKRMTGGGRITTDYHAGNDDTQWNQLIVLWFDTFCRGERAIPTIFCMVDSTTLNYAIGSVKFNFTLKLSTSIEDELFFKSWRDAIQNNEFSNSSYTFDHLFFGNYVDECASTPCLVGSTCVNVGNGFQCTCFPGYKGTLCNVEIDECESNPCLHNSTCTDQFNQYTCLCTNGFTGSRCQSDINECQNNPCLSGSTCVDAVNGYSCTCVTGYTGTHCETDLDECASTPCLLSSTCVDEVNGYSCTCVPGYTGTLCNIDINECQSAPCLSGSTCVDVVNGYSCTCAIGYTGSHCDMDIDDCMDEVNGYSCVCAVGYTGAHCETDINECLSNPCLSGSTCQEEINGYSCECVTGYTGTHCQTDIPECGSDPCLNNSTCADQVNGYLCLCNPGLTGVYCERDINECLSTPCVSGSTCVDLVNGYSCTCVTGYTGTHCETDINKCFSNPCLSGSSCQDEINGYSCECITGYTGTHCQTDINECQSAPCLSGSTCVDVVNGYSCTCAIGYTGSHCDMDIDDCLSSPCISGSTCMDAVNGYSCVCAVGYTGAHCETDINECLSTPCISGSTCVDLVSGYSCTCVTGYTGTHCETDINKCLSNPCLSGSTCEDDINGYSCECVTGYTGTHCETDIDECGSDPCLSNSTCADQVNGYLCMCRPGFSGVHCETEIYDCSDSPCQGSSTCVDEVNGYSCVCGAGYTGSHCETDINECLSNPCLSGSTCVDQVNVYVCTCRHGYTGTHCQTEMDACLSSPCPNDFRCVDQVVGYSCICDISNTCGSVRLTSHLPSYGPVAGGTNITLTGIFTDIMQLTFTLHKQDGKHSSNDSLVCITVSRNQTHALMTTPRVDDSHSGVKYIIQASYTDVHGVSASIQTQFVFTYKPNPTVTDIYPREALLSGGIKVTAIGTNLDSVSSPVLTITVEERIYGHNNSEYTVGQRTQYLSDNTTVNNSTSIIATTPEIPQSTSDDENSPGKHQQNVAFFGVKFDGVKKYNNLSEELGDNGSVQLYSDPEIQGFKGGVLMYDSQTDTHIEIKGERFTVGARIQDYTVTIGDGLCEIQSPLLDNAVACKPPSSEPKGVAVTGKELRQGQPLVMMFVGNAKFYIGYIDYKEGKSILLYILPPVVGLIIVVILIISIVACRKRNRNHNNKTKKPSTADNQSTMSSAMRSEYLSTTSSPNIESSYLNTTSSQGRYRENLQGVSQPCKEETGRMYTHGYHVSPDQLNIQLYNCNTRYRDGYLAQGNRQHDYENTRGCKKAKPKNVRLQRVPFDQNPRDAISEGNPSEARHYSEYVLPHSNRGTNGY